jgi:hypothetical protein
VAAPSDAAQLELGEAAGLALGEAAGLELGEAAGLGHAAARSHLADGRCLGWFVPAEPGVRVAVDAELDVPPPPGLVARYGGGVFWERWTRAECAAKLTGVPIAGWLRRHGLEVPALPGLWLRTFRPTDLAPDLVVTLARLTALPA